MKAVFAFAVCCLGFVLLVGAFELFSEYSAPYARDARVLPAAIYLPWENKESQISTLLFVGDIMLDRGVAWEIQKNGGDWTWPFHHIAEFLREADLVFGNLESQISGAGENVGSIYSFRADPHSIEGLTHAGFDVLSVANNHSFDYGKEAFEDSITRLTKSGIAPITDSLVIKQVQGATVGFLAYSNFVGAGYVDWENLEEVIQRIKAAQSQVDILVVSLHAGEEYASEPSEFQKVFSQGTIEAGADLVIGHHSHVVQPLVPHTRKDRSRGWIAYGLGNFVFDQNFSEETMRGAIIKVILEDKKIKEVSLLPTRLNSSHQVLLEE